MYKVLINPNLGARFVFLATFFLFAVSPLLLVAQELEEVIVTAQKKTESLQEVPISVDAFNAEQIRNARITGFEDVALYAPGLNVTPAAANSNGLRLSIRGISSADPQLGLDSKVALYVDGVYIGKSSAVALDNVDIARIEVLKGPQGTLYGRNVVAGAINIISQKPDVSAFFAEVSGSGFNYGDEASVMLNMPFSDSLAGKFSFMSKRDTGWVENTGQGENFNGHEREAVRFDLRWQPSDALTVDYSFSRNDAENQPYYYQPIGDSGNATLLAGATVPTHYDGVYSRGQTRLSESRQNQIQSSVDINSGDVKVLQHTLAADWQFADNHLAKLILGIREADEVRTTYFFPELNTAAAGATFYGAVGRGLAGIAQVFGIGDLGILRSDFAQIYAPAPVHSMGARDGSNGAIEYDQTSLELNFSGQLGGNLDYIAGFYYLDEEVDEPDNPQPVEGDLFQLVPTLSWAGYARRLGDAAARSELLTLMRNGRATTNDYEGKTEAMAVYGQVSWSPFEALRLTLGARASDEDREATLRTYSIFFVDTRDMFGAEIPLIQDKRSFDSVDPAFNVSWFFTENAMAYFNYATGFRSGGFNESGVSTQTFNFDNEEVVSYEFGLKSDWFDNRLRLNLALFSTDIDDLQISYRLPGNPAVGAITNTPATNDGFELNFLIAATESLRLGLNYGYLDSQIDDFVNLYTNELEERSNVGAPRHSLNLSVDWDKPVGPGTVLMNFSYNYKGETFLTNRVYRDPVVLLNMRVAYVEPIGDQEISIAFWGQNLLDEEYMIDRINFGGGRAGEASAGAFAWDLATFAPPLTAGIDIAYRF